MPAATQHERETATGLSFFFFFLSFICPVCTCLKIYFFSFFHRAVLLYLHREKKRKKRVEERKMPSDYTPETSFFHVAAVSERTGQLFHNYSSLSFSLFLLTTATRKQNLKVSSFYYSSRNSIAKHPRSLFSPSCASCAKIGF